MGSGRSIAPRARWPACGSSPLPRRGSCATTTSSSSTPPCSSPATWCEWRRRSHPGRRDPRERARPPGRRVDPHRRVGTGRPRPARQRCQPRGRRPGAAGRHLRHHRRRRRGRPRHLRRHPEVPQIPLLDQRRPRAVGRHRCRASATPFATIAAANSSSSAKTSTAATTPPRRSSLGRRTSTGTGALRTTRFANASTVAGDWPASGATIATRSTPAPATSCTSSTTRFPCRTAIETPTSPVRTCDTNRSTTSRLRRISSSPVPAPRGPRLHRGRSSETSITCTDAPPAAPAPHRSSSRSPRVPGSGSRPRSSSATTPSPLPIRPSRADHQRLTGIAGCGRGAGPIDRRRPPSGAVVSSGGGVRASPHPPAGLRARESRP